MEIFQETKSDLMKTNKNLERMADKAKKDSDSMAKRMAEFRLAIANIDTVV